MTQWWYRETSVKYALPHDRGIVHDDDHVDDDLAIRTEDQQYTELTWNES